MSIVGVKPVSNKFREFNFLDLRPLASLVDPGNSHDHHKNDYINTDVFGESVQLWGSSFISDYLSVHSLLLCFFAHLQNRIAADFPLRKRRDILS
jgi:hypothetical protein